MIVKDESKVIDKCLNSIKDVVDEIIIVDTGSKDETIKICEKYTHKIYNFKWINDFSTARNYSLSKATCDYIIWLDADDYLNDEEIKKLKEFKSNIDGSIDMYYFLYNFNNNYEPFYRERIFKNNRKFKFVGKIHEVIVPTGSLKYENIVITQQEKENKDIKRNLKIYEEMNINEFSVRDYYYYAKELYRNKKYNKSLKYLKKFLNFDNIYNEDAIDACYTIALIFIITSNNTNALKYLFKSFIYDLPRSNVLCEIANIYFNNNDIYKAIYYYNMALSCKHNNKGFILKDYNGYFPSLMLCLCYDRLNDFVTANIYNELANSYKNVPEIYEHNKQYFKSLLK